MRAPRASRSGQTSGPLSGWNQVTKPSAGNNGATNGTQLNSHSVPIVSPPVSSKITPLPASILTNKTPFYIHGIEGSSVIANNSKGGTLTITEGFQDTDLIDKLINNASVELQGIDTSQAERRQMLGAAINLLESLLPSPAEFTLEIEDDEPQLKEEIELGPPQTPLETWIASRASLQSKTPGRSFSLTPPPIDGTINEAASASIFIEKREGAPPLIFKPEEEVALTQVEAELDALAEAAETTFWENFLT